MASPRRIRRIALFSRLFTGTVLGLGLVAALTAGPGASVQRGRYTGDAFSAGFFSLLPGARPLNVLRPSRYLRARPSYAWRIHGNKRELVAFSTPIQHIVVIYMENRTPEDLFGGFFGVTNPTTGRSFGTDLDLLDPESLSPPLKAVPLNDERDPNHEHEPGFTADVNGSWGEGYVYTETPGPLSTPPRSSLPRDVHNADREVRVRQSRLPVKRGAKLRSASVRDCGTVRRFARLVVNSIRNG